MKKYVSLVLDHDDTAVMSTPEIHYPAFLETLAVLRPGMYAKATITFSSNKSVVLPDNCIVKQQGSGVRSVFVMNADNTVKSVQVTLGRHVGSEYEILSGISEGETVVVRGQASLKDGEKVELTQN